MSSRSTILSTILSATPSTSASSISAEDEESINTYATRFESLDVATDLPALEKELSSKTYLVGNTLSRADISLFASLHTYIASATHATLLTHPSITRHFSHLQSLPLIAAALVNTAPLVEINVADVPDIIRIVEVKVKKVKPEGAPVEGESKKEKKAKAAAAVAAVAAAESAKSDTTVSIPVEAVAVIGEGGGVTGGEGVKKVKAPKEKKVQPPVVPESAPAPWMIDLRVGTIIDVKLHPDADTLYVETIDIGEAEPRTVVSGLVNYIPIDQMMGRTLITVYNLKPANMRGVKSFAMVLCASSKEGKAGGIEFVDPPVGSKPGDRVFFEGFESQTALELLNPKKKIFETVQPGFTTLETKEAAWIDQVGEEKKVYRIMTSRGVCSVPSFVGASLS